MSNIRFADLAPSTRSAVGRQHREVAQFWHNQPKPIIDLPVEDDSPLRLKNQRHTRQVLFETITRQNRIGWVIFRYGHDPAQKGIVSTYGLTISPNLLVARSWAVVAKAGPDQARIAREAQVDAAQVATEIGCRTLLLPDAAEIRLSKIVAETNSYREAADAQRAVNLPDEVLANIAAERAGYEALHAAAVHRLKPLPYA